MPVAKVTVLLGLFEGQTYLRAQLDSLAAQSVRNWRLVVSDDSTTPDCTRIAIGFADRTGAGRVRILSGPRMGAARNYLHLLQNIPDNTAFVALCDQDDVWHRDKLARALDMLGTVAADHPAAVFTARTVCGPHLEHRRDTPPPQRPPAFQNALVQNILPGNTIVMNAAAATLCARMASSTAAARDIVAHDWWLYQILTGAGASILFDPRPSVLYRQHGANLIGAARGIAAVRAAVARLQQARHRIWNTAQVAALGDVAAHFSAENQRILSQFAAMRRASLWPRLCAFAGLGLYRQTRTGQAALWLQAVLGRI